MQTKTSTTVGASQLAAVLGISPYQTPWEAWATLTGRLEPWRGNNATRAGTLLENAVLDAAEEELQRQLYRQYKQSHDTLPLHATCDAIVLETLRPVEAKTTGIVGPVSRGWGDELTDQIPEYYAVQVHAQLLCTDADLAYLFALIAGRGIVRYEIERNPRIDELIAERLTDW